MALMISILAFIAVITTTIAVDEHVNWMRHYDEAGREDREYQQQKTDKSYGIEYSE